MKFVLLQVRVCSMRRKALVVSICFLLSSMALGEELNLPGINISGAGQQEISSAIQVLVLLTVLSLAPAILVVVTSFTRIVVVLSMLRHAIGLQNTPPNSVLICLALFLSLFTMMPVIKEIDDKAYTPLVEEQITSVEAVDQAAISLRDFLVRHTREEDLIAIIEISGEPRPGKVEDISLSSLIPAFMLSELQVAFQIGFVIFLPFLLIDLVVASVLMSMGMIMVPPLTISLPVKVLMFVLIEGWVLVSQVLVGSFL